MLIGVVYSALTKALFIEEIEQSPRFLFIICFFQYGPEINCLMWSKKKLPHPLHEETNPSDP